MAAPVAPMPYTITQSFRGSTEDVYSVRDFGDFFSIIDFVVTFNGISKPFNGIIFQLITKNTVIVFNNKILSKTKEILNFTNKNVNFMTETYIEYFEVKNSIVQNADQFQNGAITKYKNKNVDYTNVSEYGIILQKGECVFIPSSHTGPLIDPYYIWKKDKKHASNGLWYFDDTCNPLRKMYALWNLITNARQSNIVCHTVEYYWRKDRADEECSSNVFVERMNKTQTEIKPYFVKYNTYKTLNKVKTKVDEMILNQKPTCALRRSASINTRTIFVKPMGNPGGVKRVGSKPVLTIKTRIKPSARAAAKRSSARIRPGGGTIKSKKRRQTVKNRKKHNIKTVKRRK
jgi:hypothetical protein